MHDPLIRPGRPRIEVDYALVVRLREEEHLGWSRGATKYREQTSQWISKDTFKRRYFEAKSAVKRPKTLDEIAADIKSTTERIIEEMSRKLK